MKKSKDAMEAALEKAAEQLLAELEMVLGTNHVIRDAVNGAFRPLTEMGSDALSDVAAAHASEKGEQAKNQSAAFELRLATQRSAASVQMNNQVAQMVATHQKTMDEKIKQLVMGGDVALQDAYQKLHATTEVWDPRSCCPVMSTHSLQSRMRIVCRSYLRPS